MSQHDVMEQHKGRKERSKDWIKENIDFCIVCVIAFLGIILGFVTLVLALVNVAFSSVGSLVRGAVIDIILSATLISIGASILRNRATGETIQRTLSQDIKPGIDKDRKAVEDVENRLEELEGQLQEIKSTRNQAFPTQEKAFSYLKGYGSVNK